MISLRVSPQEALLRVGSIPHATARKGSKTHWRLLPNGRLDPRSICWLYCWAKTGMGSENAAREAQLAFDAILDKSYDWVASRLDHGWAREARYATRDISAEFLAQLSHYRLMHE